MWVFKPDHRQLQSLYLAGLVGNAALSILGLVYNQCINVSERSFSQGLKPFWPARLLCTLAILAQAPFSQGDLVEASLLEKDREDTFIPLSDQAP